MQIRQRWQSLRVLTRWMLGIGLSGLLVFISAYLGSASYAAKQLLTALTTQTDGVQVRTVLLGLLPRLPQHAPIWHGAGQRYLTHVWPQVSQQDDPLAMLRLYAQQPNHRPQFAYHQRFQRYVIRLGDPQQPVLIWLKRTGVLTWQPYAICTDIRQPSLDLNRCPSDSR